ncbi:MetQ/NlpA family ABC transporter substrate-binding protein [Poseidonibacter lekithochrous]|uniref:MetQ/NlpA family ABC transporter substrate-binding protein n=1 Tax=Poseidonibacter TaxID=2321187 RepID=UPI001C0986F3|nr:MULTISPECIES: MetQ/NlpA family ABC transporter substrate-binding protein [Poseidonibacter]MBU3013403.1 MetQ/NlpA family ABC transporter substrate-binding protein [Poseidonibacter lekithochrous]MDO6826700.1 MetQ/NlpA family ABC transporter substrate-binding protein [Poseidonibacter sp. 1_MG-2023]
MLKNILKFTMVGALALGITACTDTKESKKSTESKVEAKQTTIKIGATPVPHVEILEAVKPLLKAKGYDLEIVEFTDYVTPNIAVDEGELDANFFQHLPYLEEFNKNKNTNLVKTVNVHLEPMGLYSNKIKALSELKDGASIAVPNDPTNESRALDILVKEGLLKFKDVDFKTVVDIIENPKNLKIKELDAPQLPRVLDEVDAAIINTNYALAANLNPLKDALVIESKDSPYANIVVVKKGNENKEYIKALNEVINSDEIKKFINEKYQGSIVEAF